MVIPSLTWLRYYFISYVMLNLLKKYIWLGGFLNFYKMLLKVYVFIIMAKIIHRIYGSFSIMEISMMIMMIMTNLAVFTSTLVVITNLPELCSVSVISYLGFRIGSIASLRILLYSTFAYHMLFATMNISSSI